MGLDIYLYRYEDFEETQRKENLYSEYENKVWEEASDYDSLSEEGKEEIRNKNREYALSLGLDEYGSDVNMCNKVEMDHPDYPDHYFKIGYFRSSYNESGIQRILKNMDLPTLDDVFNVSDGEYYIKPDWQRSLEKVEELILKFKEKGSYRVRAVYPEKFGNEGPKSEAEALKIFQDEIDKNQEKCDYNYSNSKGGFSFHNPEKVLAMIPGQNRYIFNDRPCIFVVTGSDNSWYIQALEIIRETCKFVLDKEDKEKYYLSWSG
jgi:hypothetical protein